MGDGLEATLTHQLDGRHRCQSGLGKWSRASALFASSTSVWSARLTARRSGTETEVTWKPQALEMPRLREALPSICSQQTFLAKQLLLIPGINSLFNEVRQKLK